MQAEYDSMTNADKQVGRNINRVKADLEGILEEEAKQ